MDGDDPDSFESNLGRILRARELGKTAALMSNLSPKASAPQLVGVSSKDNTQCETHCCTSSHCQSDSEDWPDDHETSTEWNCPLASRAKLMNTQSGQRWRSRIYQLFPFLSTVSSVLCMEMFYNSAGDPDIRHGPEVCDFGHKNEAGCN